MAPDRLERLRWWVCGRKKGRSRAGAMQYAAIQRERGEQLVAYRCPFLPVSGHAHWHVGRPASMRTLRTIAEYLRERHAGNHPTADQTD